MTTLSAPRLTRQQLLETAFSDLPSKIGEFTLRRLSPGSFTLLGRLGNPMMVGKSKPLDAAAEEDAQQGIFEAVIQYAWVHSADLDVVAAVETLEDLPALEIRKMGFAMSMGEALSFIAKYQECTLRMSASLAEIQPEDDKGKLGKLELLPVGSLPSSTPAEPAAIPSGSDTSSGSCPSREPSLISTLPTLQTEPSACGPSPTSPTKETATETTPLN